MPSQVRVGGSGQASSVDRLTALEGKLARMESRPRTDNTGKERLKTHTKPMIHGKELCFDFNSRQGCKRTSIPGGCKTYKREVAHACNVWVKAKSAYCLLAHGRKDHK